MKEVKDITIKEIAKLVKLKNLEEALKFYYPHVKVPRCYGKSMLKRFTTTPTRKPKKADERLEVYAHTTDWGLKDGGVDEQYGIHTIELDTIEYGKPKSWSMSFRPWNELINLKPTSENFERYRLTDILAHFIYEITWYGPEARMIKQGKKLFASVKKIEKEHKDKKLKK